ncbi:hypothetical protein [Streptomyces sp. H62]
MSAYLAPPCLPVAVGAAVSLRITWPHPGGLLWGLFGSGTWALLCAAMALVGARLGGWPSLTPSGRRPRLLLLSASAVAGVCVWLLCVHLGAPAHLLAVGRTAPLLAVLVLACTLAANVSLHTASAAASVTLLALYLGAGWAVLYVLVAAVGWSRLHLRVHTRLQVLSGAALGTSVCAAAVLLHR